MRRMKRTVRIVSLVLVLAMALSIGANAATVCDIAVDKTLYPDCKVVPMKGETAETMDDFMFSTVYFPVDGVDDAVAQKNSFCAFVGAQAYQLTFSPKAVSEDFMVFMLKVPVADEGKSLAALNVVPTSIDGVSNIVYINQSEGSAKHTFLIYPSELDIGEYVICVSSSTDGYEKIGKLTVVKDIASSTFMLGNANDSDSSIDMMDVTKVLQHSVKKITLAGNTFLAGDVNHDNVIDIMDVTLILQYAVKKIFAF